MSDEQVSPKVQVLLNEIQNLKDGLGTMQTKSSVANTMIGELTGQMIEIRSYNVFLQTQNTELLAQLEQSKSMVTKLEAELKTLHPEDTANQLIELNNQLATFAQENKAQAEDNARLNRVVAALDARIGSLMGTTNQPCSGEQNAA